MLLFEVDISRLGLLRRLGLKKLVSLFRRAGKEIDDLSIPWIYVQPLPSTISRFKGDVKLTVLKEKLEKMHPVDLADIFEDMDPDQRVMIFSELNMETASDTLEEIDPPIQREIVSSLKMEHIVALVNEMTPGQTADILTALPHIDAQEILLELDPEKARKVRSILERSDESINNYTTSAYISLPPDALVGQVQDEYPRLAKGKDVIMYLYIVNEGGLLEGVIDIKDLLKAEDNIKLVDIMVDDVITLTKDSTLKEAAHEFSRYDFRALPVVDDENIIIGVLPYRDVMKLQHHFLD
jgi:magnesium transporter